ncbi:MAG TPA: hypothetical protein VHT51_11710 [Micropepsaceae bacterium]|jgi:hypothetical protein|nr:hypothetical protein [Micropepsaceae bacterium]
MSKCYTIWAALLATALAPLLQGATPLQPQGEIVGDDIYVNCEYRMAAQFPKDPKVRDITYRDGNRTSPGRQFYFDRPAGQLSVTVVHFSDGPEVDKAVIERATDTLRKRGQVRFDSFVYYDDAVSAQLPGRQIQVALPNGRMLNGSVYMADHRLYITEALATTNDLEALMFSQSVSLIDEKGTDLDTNPVNVATSTVGTSAGLPSRQYDCSRQFRAARKPAG